MRKLIPEFNQQSFTQIIFPHKNSDWKEYLQEAENNFIKIIEAIIPYQKCYIICDNIQRVKKKLPDSDNLIFIEYETDDTWARDISAISIKNNNNTELLDFNFNGWGDKFEAHKDNEMSQSLKSHYPSPMKQIDFILEGGAIETNGQGLLLTTANCMLNKNRNSSYTKEEITQKLQNEFGIDDVLYLYNGYLAGDDTDSHIDTLARFIDEKTILYVQSNDKRDEHYEALKLMEDELKNFAKDFQLNLLAVPMCEAIYFKGERLPATYANFLFVNGAVLIPTYGVKEDIQALSIFQNFFQDRDIIGVDCQTLIKQHGSLHCVTMNFV